MPVILLTAQVEEASRARGAAAGATKYLAKPFSPKALAELVRRLLGLEPGA